MNKINLVKIGSESVNERNISNMLDDALIIENITGENFAFLTSGAVRLGTNTGGMHLSSQAKAGIGQIDLMNLYRRLANDKIVAQMLVEDYFDGNYLKSIVGNAINIELIAHLLELIKKDKGLHFAKTLSEYANNGIWAVINHNDTTSSQELKNLGARTDNDQNSVLICEEVNAFCNETGSMISRVIYLTNTDGLLDQEGNTIKGGQIKGEKDKDYYRSFCREDKSKTGTGAMISKVNCGFKALDLGVEEVIIANSKNGLQCLLAKQGPFTTFCK